MCCAMHTEQPPSVLTGVGKLCTNDAGMPQSTLSPCRMHPHCSHMETRTCTHRMCVRDHAGIACSGLEQILTQKLQPNTDPEAAVGAGRDRRHQANPAAAAREHCTTLSISHAYLTTMTKISPPAILCNRKTMEQFQPDSRPHSKVMWAVTHSHVGHGGGGGAANAAQRVGWGVLHPMKEKGYGRVAVGEQS